MRLLVLLLSLAALAASEDSCKEPCSIYIQKQHEESCYNSCSFRTSGLPQSEEKCLSNCDSQPAFAMENVTDFVHETTENVHLIPFPCRYGCAVTPSDDDSEQVNVDVQIDPNGHGYQWTMTRMFRLDRDEMGNPVWRPEAGIRGELDDGELEAHLSRMRMNLLRELSNMRRRFDMMRNGDSSESDEFEDIARSRPSGHAATGGSEVGNLLNGQAIIITHRLNPEGSKVLNISPSDRRSIRHSGLHLPDYLGIASGILILITGFLIIFMIAKARRANRYRRMNSVFGVQQIIPPSSKKADEAWVAHSTPSGVPPPAYDQVSIHKVSTDSAVTTGTPSP